MRGKNSISCLEYQPSGEGDTRSLPATPATLHCALPATAHRLLDQKWPTGSENKSNTKLLDPLKTFC